MATNTEAAYEIEPIPSAPFGQIAYVAWRKGLTKAIVVDPGFDVAAIEHVLDRHRLDLAAILNTHGHIDHIAGNEALKQRFPESPIIIGRHEAHLLADPDANLSGPFGMPVTSPPADRLVEDGDRLEVAGFSFLVREITGHSPGSVVFICDDAASPFAFVGDVLFSGSVGRTDFPGGSARSLLDGIRDKLWSLPDATLVLPGHGPPTTIGQEKRTNPFLTGGGVFEVE